MSACTSADLSARQLVIKFVLSAAAATVAESVTFPLDLTKTRLQIQGEQNIVSSANRSKLNVKKGMLSTAEGIVTKEGITGLWSGVTPAIYRHVVYTGARMGFYEILRDSISSRSTEDRFPVWKAALCGMIAGAFGQFLANPADLVKVQMQMEGRLALEGTPRKFRGAGHAFLTIYAEKGFRGLWRGWAPNVQRAALVNMGDLTTYDSVKHYLLRNTKLQDNWFTHALSRDSSVDPKKSKAPKRPTPNTTTDQWCGCAGFVAAVLSTPADVVKTRIMNQPYNTMGKPCLYKSSIDCLLKTVQKEGFFALYKGFMPIYLRMAPWSLTFWISYEEIRKLSGVQSF